MAVPAFRVDLLGLDTTKQLDCLQDSVVCFAMVFKQVELTIKQNLAFKTSRLVTQESFLNLDNLRLKLGFMFSSLSFCFNFR